MVEIENSLVDTRDLRITMNERQSFSVAVDEMMGTLTETLHTVIDGIILKTYNCFTEGERQEINASKTNIKKVEEFFRTLKTKGVDAYERCLTAMNDLHHPDLARTLREKWRNASSLVPPIQQPSTLTQPLQVSTLAHLPPASQPTNMAHQPQLLQASSSSQPPSVTQVGVPSIPQPTQSLAMLQTPIVGQKLKLFISYGREEITNDFAERLHEYLKSEGYEPTLDAKDFLIGDSLSQVISGGIANCDAMIIILSQKYSTSQWCIDELKFAKQENKKLFIIKRQEDCNLSVQVKYQIGDGLYLKIIGDDEYDDKFDELNRALVKHTEELGIH